MPDPRAEHFWDLWSFGSKNYTRQFNYPPNDIAWDIFVLYKPQIVWRDATPEPTVWMQHRDLKIGIPYSQEALETELQKWMR